MKKKILGIVLTVTTASQVYAASSPDLLEIMARQAGWTNQPAAQAAPIAYPAERPQQQVDPEAVLNGGGYNNYADGLTTIFNNQYKQEALSNQIDKNFSLAPYFMFPIESVNHAGTEFKSSAGAKTQTVGMIYRYQQSNVGLKLLLAPKLNQSRRDLSAELARSGAIKTGDILVSVRPGLARTSGYVNMQLLATHNSIAVVRRDSDGVDRVYNVDMPANSEYISSVYQPNSFSTLDSKHFLDDAGFLSFHILRPRINAAQRENIRQWLELALKNNRSYYQKNLIFNSDYMNPYWAQVQYNRGSLFQGIKHVANSLKGQGQGQISIFCSEFTWMILALRNCSTTGNLNSCVQPLFEPMKIFGDYYASGRDSENAFGMNDGLITLAKTLYPNDEINQVAFIKDSFKAYVNSSALSEGHRMTDKQLKDMGFYEKAERYITSALQGRANKALGNEINNMFAENYSPTAFVSQAMIPDGFSQKKLDYVGTLRFGNEPGYLNLIKQIKQ